MAEEIVVLGSGELYAIKYKELADPLVITETEVAKLVNLGHIESNAKLIAKKKSVTVNSANHGKVGSFDGDKDVTFSTGIISWNLSNVAKFLTGSDYTEVTDTKTFTYANSDRSPNVFLRFVYTNVDEGQTVTIDIYKCKFNGDLTFDFNTKNPISFDYNFDVMSVSTGTKDVYFKVVDKTTTV